MDGSSLVSQAQIILGFSSSGLTLKSATLLVPFRLSQFKLRHLRFEFRSLSLGVDAFISFFGRYVEHRVCGFCAISTYIKDG